MRMQSWIALLRGINVSGQKIIRMEDLRKLLSQKGFSAVKTYIQSGNIVFESQSEDNQSLAAAIETAIREQYGFEVPVWVVKAAEIQHYLQQNPFTGEGRDPKRVFFSLLNEVPDGGLATAFLEKVVAPEEVVVTDRMVYLYIPENYARSKLSNNFVEKALKCKATTRNANTLEALLKLAAD